MTKKRRKPKRQHRWVESDMWRGDPEALAALAHIKGIGYKSKSLKGLNK